MSNGRDNDVIKRHLFVSASTNYTLKRRVVRATNMMGSSSDDWIY
jgi:hypothetical protein